LYFISVLNALRCFMKFVKKVTVRKVCSVLGVVECK